MSYIRNSEANTLISGTNDNDTVINGGWFEGGILQYGGSNVTIDAGEGDDYIYNYVGSEVTISAGNGNDSMMERLH